MCIISAIIFYIFAGFVCWSISYGNFSSCAGMFNKIVADSDECCGLGAVAATKFNNINELLRLDGNNRADKCTACQGNLLSFTTSVQLNFESCCMET